MAVKSVLRTSTFRAHALYASFITPVSRDWYLRPTRTYAKMRRVIKIYFRILTRRVMARLLGMLVTVTDA